MAKPAAKKKGGERKRKGRVGSFFRKLLLFMTTAAAVLVVLAAAGAALVVWYYGRELPELGDLREDYRPPQTTRIVTADGELLGELFVERRTVVPFERIPRVLVQAVLAAEDADFYQHEGLDYPGILRALLINVREGRLAQGASTITQQVVQTFYVGRTEVSFSRKIREALLARRLEQHLTKDEILFLYLNQIDFGHEHYGVEEASRFFFGRDVQELELHQAALLAGLPQGPSLYYPFRHPERARTRRNWVLGQMEAHGFASAAEVAAARQAPLDLRQGPRRDEGLAPEVAGPIRRQLEALVGEEQARLGGYTVRTTIDSRLQRSARQAVDEGLVALDGRHDYRGPLRSRRGDLTPPNEKLRSGRTYRGEVVSIDDAEGTVTVRVGKVTGVLSLQGEARYNPEKLKASAFAEKGARAWVSFREEPPEEGPGRLRLELGPEAALVAIEPGTGKVLALVGGYAPRPGDFDRASNARRQPGSAFKPFVYSLALRSKRFTPATVVNDAPEIFEEWRPQNFEEWSYRGPVRLRQALAESINMVAVKLIRDVGPEEVAAYAKRLGIESPLEATPALALGASAVTPLEMAEAYGVFASGGVHAEPILIDEVRGPDGRLVPLESPEPEQVIEPAEAYLMATMLRSVIREGTARDARGLDLDAGGKTGTSNDARDAWFVGFTRDVVCAVWVGFDDSRSLGRRESGSRAALPIWVQFMRAAHRGRPRRDFERPDGIVVERIDPATGLLAYEGEEGAIEEEFLEGTTPTERAIPPDTADPDTFLMEQTEDDAPPVPGAGAAEPAAPLPTPEATD